MRASSLILLAGLCVTGCAQSGYYDNMGVYHAYGAGDSTRTNSPAPGGNAVEYQDRTQYQNDYRNNAYRSDNTYVAPQGGTTVIYDRPATTYRNPQGSEATVYDRPGAYDYNGYYISSDSGPEIPGRYFPPQGMCRVWFTDRAYSEQPPVESCHGIDQRVPAGAYVVYGG